MHLGEMAAVLLMGSTLLACVGLDPVRVGIDVAGEHEARVKARLVKGDVPPEPEECNVPCAILVAPDHRHEISVSAPGYYPVTVEVEYLSILQAGEDPAEMVVPMVERPEIAPAR